MSEYIQKPERTPFQSPLFSSQWTQSIYNKYLPDTSFSQSSFTFQNETGPSKQFLQRSYTPCSPKCNIGVDEMFRKMKNTSIRNTNLKKCELNPKVFTRSVASSPLSTLSTSPTNLPFLLSNSFQLPIPIPKQK